MTTNPQRTYPLRIIQPVGITPDVVVSTNVPDDDLEEFDYATVYSVGDRIVDPSTQKVWESLADENEGNIPWLSPDKWGSPGVTNKWRLFDEKISTITHNPNEITYRFKVGRAISNVVIMNVMNAFSVQVRVIDPTYGEAFNETRSLRPVPRRIGWWGWYFGRRTQRTQTIFSDLPTLPQAEIEVKILGTELLGVGMLLLGDHRSFGKGVNYGARAGLTSYSRVLRDQDTGEVSLLRRPTSRRSNFTITLHDSEEEDFFRFLVEIEAVPVFVAAYGQKETLSGYGVLKNADIIYSDFNETDCSVEFDGFI